MMTDFCLENLKAEMGYLHQAGSACPLGKRNVGVSYGPDVASQIGRTGGTIFNAPQEDFLEGLGLTESLSSGLL